MEDVLVDELQRSTGSDDQTVDPTIPDNNLLQQAPKVCISPTVGGRASHIYKAFRGGLKSRLKMGGIGMVTRLLAVACSPITLGATATWAAKRAVGGEGGKAKTWAKRLGPALVVMTLSGLVGIFTGDSPIGKQNDQPSLADRLWEKAADLWVGPAVDSWVDGDLEQTLYPDDKDG